MSDRKAAMERAKWIVDIDPDSGRRNLAAAFLEAEADLEKFRQAEIRWLDEAAAKDAELEQERKAREEAERNLDIAKYGIPGPIAEQGLRYISMQARAESAEQRAADLQARLDRVEAATIERCATRMDMIGMDWRDAGDMAKFYATNYLIEQVRDLALSAQPNAAAGQESNGRGNTQAGEAEQSVSVPAPSAAPDAALPGLELAARICESCALQIGEKYYPTMSKRCAEAIRAEIERRRA